MLSRDLSTSAGAPDRPASRARGLKLRPAGSPEASFSTRAPRRASADRPVRPRWHPGRIGLGLDMAADREGTKSFSPSP
eukprot:scaffold20635_cov62-Phaeocystis_antarctica.AAC.2